MIEYKVKPSLTNEQLNNLFEISWAEFLEKDFSKILVRSLTFVCAFKEGKLIGFVNIAWDGDLHAFLLDTTVHPDFRKQGIGTQLVLIGIEESKKRGIEWIHVDYELKLDHFYKKCGFKETKAGLLNLKNKR